jgi:hypothetical protein
MILVAATVSAQMEAGIGVKGGLNLSQFKVLYEADVANEGKSYTSKPGFHAGVFAQLKIKNFAIQPELLFSQQGSYFKYYYPSNGYDEKWTADFNYFTIPLSVKYTLLSLDEGDLNVQAGLQYSRLLSAKVDYNDIDGDGAQSRGEAVDVKEAFAKSDLSAQLGLGWELPMGLSMDIRYYLGLQIITLDSNRSSRYDYGYKNQVFQVSVAYRLFRFDL